jgi:DNA topoisomerase-1
VVKKAAAKKAAAKKTAADKPARKAVAKKPAAKKAAKKAVAKKSPLPYSSGIAPAKPLLTAAKVEPGKKRVVKKTNHGDAPF